MAGDLDPRLHVEDYQKRLVGSYHNVSAVGKERDVQDVRAAVAYVAEMLDQESHFPLMPVE